MTNSLRIFLLSLGTGLSACGTPDIEDYPRELEEAYCAWQHGCHVYEKVGDCIDARRIEGDPRYEYLLRAVAAGAIEYDRDAAASCLAAVRARSCDDYEPDPEVCGEVYVGKVGRNAPCINSAECAGNAVCGFDPSCTDACCVGACRVFADPLEVGAPCSFQGVGCVESAYCAPDPMTGLPTVCTARVKAGGDCSLGQQCDADSSCDGGTCRAIDLRKEGETCGGQFERCEAPSNCEYRGDEPALCLTPPGLGAPCDPDYFGCRRVDAFCDRATLICTLLPGPGQACVDGYQCLPYASCQSQPDGMISSCIAKAGEGEACGQVDDVYINCLGDLQCLEDGRCGFPELSSTPCPVPGG